MNDCQRRQKNKPSQANVLYFYIHIYRSTKMRYECSSLIFVCLTLLHFSTKSVRGKLMNSHQVVKCFVLSLMIVKQAFNKKTGQSQQFSSRFP